MKNLVLLLLLVSLLLSCNKGSEKELLVLYKVNEKLELSNTILQYRIDRLLTDFEASMKENPQKIGPFYLKSEKISNQCDSIYDLIFSLKENIRNQIENYDENIYKQKNKSVAHKILNRDNRNLVYSKIQSLKKIVSALYAEFGDKYSNLFEHTLEILDISISDFKKQFDVNSAAEALIILSGIENDIKRIHGNMLSLFFSQIDAGSFKFNPLPSSVNLNLSLSQSSDKMLQNNVFMGDFDRNGFEYLKENDFLNPINEPLTTFSVDVDVASYGLIRKYLNYDAIPPVGAVRIEEMINYFNYDYPQPEDRHPFSVSQELSECPWNKNHQLLMLGLKGKEIKYDKLPPSNLVFLLDVSGSMESEDKLPLLKKALSLLIKNLRPVDKVAIVVYAGSSGLVLPSTSIKNKKRIFKAIENLSAGGSTAGGEGIILAYKVAKENFIENGNNRVILATDGDFNVGLSSDDELVRLIEDKRKTGIFLSVLGFGFGNFQDAKMEKLSNAGNGNYAYIDNIKEAKKVLVTEFGGTIYTIAKDVKLQLEFNPVYVKSYRLIGYENRVLMSHEFDDDKVDAGDIGAGHTVTALYEIELQNNVTNKNESLKYQETAIKSSAYENNELGNLKLRYKKPDQDKSILQSIAINNKSIALFHTSNNYRFACSVTQFGLLIRKSKYKENATINNVLELAKSSLGNDKEGLRSEYLQLVNKYKSLTTKTK